MTAKVEQLKREVARWSPWWIGMWAVNVVILLAAVPFVTFGHWVTAVLILFGVPEAFGTWRDDDAFPPLTHVIVKYVDREISFPLIFFFYASSVSYWLGFTRPWRLGAFAALLGWLTSHFERRYERR